MIAGKCARIYPRSIEFDENIFRIVEDNVVVGLCDDNGDWAFLFLRDGFALDAGFHGSVEVTGHKGLNIGSRDFLSLVKGELLILLNILDRKRRPFFLANTRVSMTK